MASTPFSTTPTEQQGMSRRVLFLASAAVIVLVVIVALATLRRSPVTANAALAPDAYASQLAISNIELSEATNGTGGKVTYIDGHLQNNGPRTLTAATVQVGFQSQDGSPAHRELAALTLVRTRQPYVDLEPVSAEPLRAGQGHDFRLIFDTVPENWDQKSPAMIVTHAETR